MLRRYFFTLDPARSRWRRADPFPWAKSPRRSQPMAAGEPVPVSQIAATIAADGGNSSRSSHPPAFSTVSHGKNAASAGARPSPSGFYPRLPPAERTLRRAALAPLREGRHGRPGRKKHLPFYNITCKNEKERPSRAKNIPYHKASPSNNKKQAADSGEKRSAPLPDGRHKKQKKTECIAYCLLFFCLFTGINNNK